ncbi:uncharacterized protein BDR25DRAFT_236045 [Lindgomyces ingoldianus]|uniref:Uncharacterized protein n=1 Tax=Lindgomyces ingoldianus TaxID=673940 RepID=A0ACB6QIR1_9PLEO|nr:uncharacterized protein BDR25DRAFT_236045 [Lindgomyces ingoldianus]KAF2466904.1 hypothetical protein BDR25DRAFT_236045 [Lindgomyces ingoldianus]
MQKRQGGYYPTTHFCGRGDTCAEACGATYVQCPSDAGIYCYDPTIGEHCCPDGTGNSCSAGYFCSHDGAGTTYCCPDGMELSECAAAYSLTVSLIKETGSVPVPTGGSTVIPASTTPIHVSYPTAAPSTKVYPTGNATYSTVSPPQFTGAAAKVVGGGMAVLAGAAGLAGIL